MGNVLVVDDERSIRATVKAFLEADGHCVEVAQDVECALALLPGKSIDVVLADIILPRLSGVELLRRIRDMSLRCQVIMMTGEPSLETAAESLRHGALDYLQKPIGKNEILKAVRNAMHVKRLNDEKLVLEEENRKYMNHLEQLVESRTHALAASEAALRQRAEELLILHRLARKVNESMTVDGSIQCGLSEIANAVAPDLAVFFLRSGEELVRKGVFPDRPGNEWRPQRVRMVGTCLCGMAAGEGCAVYSSDVRCDSRCTQEECRNAGISSFAALPLRVGAEVIGVLGIASFERRDFSEHASFLEAVVEEMGVGLNKCLLYERVQQGGELTRTLSRAEEGEAEQLALIQNLQRSQRMEAVGTLASGIAHDFNNILAVVIGCTELALRDTPRGSGLWKNLERSLSASRRAADLIKQILAFSQRSEEELKPIQITYTVKDALQFMRASLPATIEIREEIDSDIGDILGDPVQIRQILTNLCTNAHHAMSGEGGVLKVTLTSVNLKPDDAPGHPHLEPGPHVKLTVEDTGCGMNGAVMEKIFDPYFSTREKGTGTGLGLAVVHGLVRGHGGAIMVRSKPGEGSAFELYFPVIQREETAEAYVPVESPPGKERILLVDDEHLLLDMSKEMFESLGYKVEASMDSREALALFRGHPDRFDLVITDLTMPNMPGDKLASELLRIRADIPVVICTGYSDDVIDEQARAMGIRAVVRKPVLMSQMAQVIRDALDGKEQDA